jgi:hypothetical protein
MLFHESNWVLTLKGRLARCDLIKNDTKGVNVAVFITRVAVRLLRRNVERRANLSTGERACRYAQKLGNAKVSEDGFPYRIVCLVACIEQNISRFEVAMNHAILMGIMNSKTDRGEELYNHGWMWNIAPPGGTLNIISQCLTFNVLHDHIGSGIICIFRS